MAFSITSLVSQQALLSSGMQAVRLSEGVPAAYVRR